MKAKIFYSTLLTAMVVFLASMVMSVSCLYDYFGDLQKEQLRDELKLATIGVEEKGVSYLEDLGDERYRLTWVAADGDVLYDSGVDEDSMENHGDREEIRMAFTTGEGTAIRYSSTKMEQSIYYAQRLADNTVLRISGSRATIGVLLHGMVQPIAMVILLAMLLSVFLADRVAERIISPLNKLDLENPLDNDSYEELTPILSRIYFQRQEIAENLSELERRKEEQEKLEHIRREFTSNVSHELKTPLQSIMGSAELIENGMVKQEDMPRFVGHIRTEAARLVKLIDDIIHLSRMDDGIHLPFETVDLLTIAHEAMEAIEDAAQSRNVKLSIKGESAVLKGVPRLLFELLYNLCDNAVKYNNQGGSVDIVLEQNEQEVSLSVSDTGIGIPQEELARVFERFYRVDKSHSKKSGGTGLGLSIVKHVAACHHAKVELQSTLGNGTTIRVIFPKK